MRFQLAKEKPPEPECAQVTQEAISMYVSKQLFASCSKPTKCTLKLNCNPLQFT